MNLTAGVTSRQQSPGSYFMILDTGAASSVDLVIRVAQQSAEHLTTAKRGTKAKLQNGATFESIELTSTVNCVVQIVISDGMVDFETTDGATVLIGNPGAILTSNDRGSPGLPVYVNGTISGNPTALAVVDDAPVAATAAVGALLPVLVNRVSARITNTGANPVAIGSATLTWAKAAVIINPGDTWVEERGANLAWYCICNTGLASTLGVQEITA